MGVCGASAVLKTRGHKAAHQSASADTDQPLSNVGRRLLARTWQARIDPPFCSLLCRAPGGLLSSTSTKAAVKFSTLIKDCERAAVATDFERYTLSNGACCFVRLLPGRPVVSLLSGLHGDERVGPTLLHQLMQRWARSRPPAVSLIVVPALNDIGWDRYERRWNRRDLNDHFKSRFETPSRELALLYETLPVPDVHLDIHEDSTTPYPYIWLDVAGRRDDPPNRALATFMDCRVVLMRKPDKSSTHFMRRRGCLWTITSEVPPSWPLRDRLRWTSKVIRRILH